MILTESELRSRWRKDKPSVVTVPVGCVLTPSARDFLSDHHIQLCLEGGAPVDTGRNAMATAHPVTQPSRNLQAKPEHMTHLYGRQLVIKTHPVIAWRGQMDQFDCAVVEAQVKLAAAGEDELVKSLEEVLRFAQRMMAAQVKQEPFEFTSLCGWNAEQIRDMSHHPDRYFGVPHTAMDYQDGPVVARLNSLRAKVREVELAAGRAFIDGDGNCVRTDIVQALNRLSSLLYVLLCRRRAARTQEKRLPIGVSNRHVHLSAEDLKMLFGAGHSLTVDKELSQPGQFAARETIRIIGPKGAIDNVRVLGPVRRETQVEISATDSFQLGIPPVVRDSGHPEGSPGLRLVGPAGEVTIVRGVIVAARHIHLHPDQAGTWRIADGQRVRIKVESERPVVFDDVLVRVNPQFQGEIHMDTDEANAALVKNGTAALILGV
ncbi:MAG: phosphate propanoyltransferase [Negativicutes bacterium]